MCCSNKRQQRLLGAGVPVQSQQFFKCAARQQQHRELRALAASLEADLVLQLAVPRLHQTGYQPRTMAGILVMGIALGLQESGKKIKEKRNERRAKKAALTAELHAPAGSYSSGAVRGHTTRQESEQERKSEEARREQQRHSFSSVRAREEDAPPSYDEVARPTYEEAMQDDQRKI